VSLFWLVGGFASIFGILVAALMMEKYHPKYAYLGYSIYASFLGISCFFLSANAERDYLRNEKPI
jgi:hypothetical protein